MQKNGKIFWAVSEKTALPTNQPTNQPSYQLLPATPTLQDLVDAGTAMISKNIAWNSSVTLRKVLKFLLYVLWKMRSQCTLPSFF